MSLSSDPGTRKTGRRPGPTRTREAIAEAALDQFSELGYDRTTMRGIARAAGVDPALVIRFHGSKEALFRSVMETPEAVGEALVAVAQGPRDDVGRRFADLVVSLLENKHMRKIILGRIRSATSHADAAALVRETVTRDLVRVATALNSDEAETRAVFIGVQVVGLALARYVVEVEPLASMQPKDVVDYVAPTFQHYLVESLP
jgi:AcrR family transcriptional regulator